MLLDSAGSAGYFVGAELKRCQSAIDGVGGTLASLARASKLALTSETFKKAMRSFASASPVERIVSIICERAEVSEF